MADESVETRVAVIERDIDNISAFFDRLDTAMEKLTDVSVSVKELLAVHELKINQAGEADTELYHLHEANKKDIVDIKSKLALHQWFFTATAALISFILYKLKIIPFISIL